MLPRRLMLACLVLFIQIAISDFSFSQSLEMRGSQTSLYQQEKAVFCQTSGQNLCVSPANDIVLTLLGCATGFESTDPAFTINVPPGEDLTFTITKNPDAIQTHFFFVSEFVANIPPSFLDICTEMDPEIYTPPLFIDPFDDPPFEVYTVPSAVVDQMVAQSNLDGFVVMIAEDCVSFLASFAGVRFTRNPVSTSPLDLSFEGGPLVIQHATTNEFVFKVENTSNQAVNDLVFEIGNNFGNVGLISVAEDGGPHMSITTVPFQKSFSLASNQFKRFTVRVTAYGIGYHSFYGQILSDFCENNGRQDVTFSSMPNPVLATLIGKGRVGDSTETELTITNPTTMPVEAEITGSDENGRGISLENIANRGSFLGNNTQLQIAPGQTQTVRFSSSDTEINRFMVHVSTNLPVLATLRQSRRIDTRDGTFNPGTTQIMRNYNTAVQAQGQGAIPYRIVAAENKKIIIDNYSLDPRSVTINVRHADTGAILRSFTGVIAKGLAILPFPLVAGLDENAYIEIDGGPGIFAELEECSAREFNVYKVKLRNPLAPESVPETFSGTTTPAIPFSQVGFPNIQYSPSTYDMFVFPLQAQGIAPNSVALEFDEQCGVGVTSTSFLLTGLANANATIPIMLPANSNLRGGFAFFDDPGTTTSFRWVEGEQTFYMQAVEPATKGRLFIPKVFLEGQITPQNAPIRFQVFSEDAMTLSTAVIATDGTLLGLKNISLTSGGHQLCAFDFGITEDAAFLEIQVPEGHPSPFWFNALADEPTLDYKDQLPLLPLEGTTLLTEIGNALAAWGEGGGPSCLGDTPDMMDLVAFVNNGYMCPATP